MASAADVAGRVSAMRASALPYAAAFEAQILPQCLRLSQRIAALVTADSRRQQRGQVEPWIQAVADYQQLYSRATVTQVTEDPQLSARVISDLWTADRMRVVVPDLRSAGLRFKRVQRLSFREQPVVQMVYLPEQGEPVALCVTRDARPDEQPHAQQIGELSTVAWRHGELGCVLPLSQRGLEHSVEKIPDAQRSAMLLVAVEGSSYREAAKVLDVPIGTVMSRLARARLTIGESLGTPAAEPRSNGHSQ